MVDKDKDQLKGDKDHLVRSDVNEHQPGDDDAPLAELFQMKRSRVHVPKTRACKI